MMKSKLFRLLFAAFVWTALTLSASCSKSDDNPDPDDGTTSSGQYTATQQVKTVTLSAIDAISFQTLLPTDVMLYEAFNNRYYLALCDGAIYFVHGVRNGGSWDYEASDSGYRLPYAFGNHWIEDITRTAIDNINQITGKVDTGKWGSASAEFQPKHGYGAYFTTDEGEIRYLRIYAKSYTLDSNQSVKSVTVEYQLY